MPFVKATPLATRFGATFYGPPGSGKTFTALLMGEGLAKLRNGRMAVIDTEGGTNPYVVPNDHRSVHPEAFDFDVIHTRSLARVVQELEAIDPKQHPFVLIDSITHLWEAAREAWQARNPNAQDIPLRAWGPIKAPYRRMIKLLAEKELDYIICGREKVLFGQGADGSLVKEGVGLKAESETQYEPDSCFRFALVGDRGSANATVTMFCEKTRWSIWQGRTYPKPSFATIEPIVPFLSIGDPKGIEDDDERAAIDSEMLDAQSDKAAKKSEKSRALLAEFRAALLAAETVEALGTVASSLKKQKRYMTEEHLGALREIHAERRSVLVNQTAGEL